MKHKWNIEASSLSLLPDMRREEAEVVRSRLWVTAAAHLAKQPAQEHNLVMQALWLATSKEGKCLDSSIHSKKPQSPQLRLQVQKSLIYNPSLTPGYIGAPRPLVVAVEH